MFNTVTKNLPKIEVFGKNENFWQLYFLPKWMPFVIGIVLGGGLAYLIAIQEWMLVISLVAIIPGAILFTSYPFVGFFIWLGLTPLVTSPKNMAHLTTFWVFHRLVVPLALILIVMPYLFRLKKEWPFRLSWPEISMAACLGYVVLSALVWGDKNFRSNLYDIYDNFFIYYCLYLLIRFSQLKEKEFRIIVWVAVAQASFQIILGILSNFAPQLLPDIWVSKNSLARTVGSLHAPGRYSSVMIFCILLTYQALMQWDNLKPRARGLFWLVFLLGLLMILLTYAKASWLAAIVIFPGLIFLYPKQTVRLVLILAVSMILFGARLLGDQLYWAQQRLENDSSQGRMVANMAMYNMVLESPVVGWGYNNLELYIETFASKIEGFAASHVISHNTYLSIMAQIGLLGFFLYIFPFIWWLIFTVKAWPDMASSGFADRHLVVLLWLSILYQFVVSNFADFRFGPYTAFTVALWWANLGLIANIVDSSIVEDEVTQKFSDTHS